MNYTPLWIRRLLLQNWTPENSLAVDRWLAYVEAEFPQPGRPRTPLHCSHSGDRNWNPYYTRLKALITSVNSLPPELQPIALRAISIANGVPLTLIQQLWERAGGSNHD